MIMYAFLFWKKNFQKNDQVEIRTHAATPSGLEVHRPNHSATSTDVSFNRLDN